MVTELNEVGKAVVVLTALVALSVRGEKCVIHLPERVTAEEVAAARVSRPASDPVLSKLVVAEEEMNVWVTEGRVPGKVLFKEDFDDSEAWKQHWKMSDGSTFGKTVKLLPDERVGNLMRLEPFGRYNNPNIVGEKTFEIDETHPIGILWEVRTPNGGNTPFMLQHFLDKDLRDIGGEYQIRSCVDPTQPLLFFRNAHLSTYRLPRGTKYIRVGFVVTPGGDVGEIAHVRIVDLEDCVKRRFAHADVVRAERASASKDAVLVHAFDDVCTAYPVQPDGRLLPGRAGDRLSVRECPGETVRGSLVLWSASAHKDLRVVFSDLVGKAGKLPAESLSAKVVKCHYQAEGAPFGWRAVSEKQVLVPELLLNDDELVVTDHDRRRNLVKCTPASSDAYYVDINTTWRKGFEASFPAADLPIRDAKTLQPFGLRADENKQLVVRIPVPKGISAGRYEGTVRIVEGSHDVANVGVSLEVLPFGLPKAETSYDPTREYTMGLYLWGSLSEDGGANLSLFRKSREQLLNEYRIMREYRIDNPLFVWRAWEVFKDDVFRRHLDVAREAGYSGTLHIGANSFRLPMDGKAIATLKTDVARAIRTAAEYGFDEVYFYGIDEARGDVLIQERPVWQAIREAGGKVCVSGYKKHFEAVGDILDMCIYAEEPGSADPAPWHRIGHRLWKYNTPQAGAEDPNVFRKAYGLRLWARGFDGASTYCNCDTPFWNDIYMQVRCKALKEPVTGTVLRALNFFYATVDGAVETIQLAGLEAAIKDVQYLTKLRQLQRARKDAETARYLDTLNLEGADPATVRREVIDRICRFYAKP